MAEPNPKPPSTQPPLRATSPQERQKPQNQSMSSPSAASPVPPAMNPNPPARSFSPWILWGTVLTGLVFVSFLPMPNYVSGKTTITSRPQKRDRLVMPRAGIVEIQVEQNDTVKPGQLLAKITSPDLDRAISEAERGFQQSQGALERAQQNLAIAQTRWQASQTETQLAALRRQDRREDLVSLQGGGGLPQSRQIRQEQAGMVQEIMGLESEIVAVQQELEAQDADVVAVRQQLENIEARLKDRQILIDQKVFPVNHDAIANLEYQKLQLEREIQTIRKQRQIQTNRINQLQSQIQQRARSIAALDERVLEVARQTELEYKNENQDYVLTAARSQASRQEVEAAIADFRAQANLAKKWQAELLRLQKEQQNLALRAKTGGTVTTKDLDLINGKRLEAGEEVLALADLSKLTATVQIRQEDHYLVDIGQSTKFSSDQGGKYRAEVNDLAPTIVEQTPGAAPTATVEILIENPEDRLLPGGEGHAHIKTQKLRIYQKVAHELGKIFDFDRLIPW